MKYLFQADDGTIFENEVECFEYESANTLLLLNGQGEILSNEEDSFYDVELIVIKDENALNYFNSLLTKFLANEDPINRHYYDSINIGLNWFSHIGDDWVNCPMETYAKIKSIIKD